MILASQCQTENAKLAAMADLEGDRHLEPAMAPVGLDASIECCSAAFIAVSWARMAAAVGTKLPSPPC